MKNFVLLGILILILSACQSSGSAAGQRTLQQGVNGNLSYIGRYSVGAVNEDGGIAEIVVFNKDNKRIYMVNGALGSLDIVDTSALRSGRFTELALTSRIDIRAMGAANGFEYGDLTSAAISTKNKLIALSVQHSSYSEPGYIVLVNYDGEYIRHYRAGVQPDMILFTPDEQYILTADEGEPREGYAARAIDPPGSVTIVNVSTNEVRVVGFGAFDGASARTAFLQSGGILNRGANPSLDFEPEYIAVSDDSRTAWVSLQEANALAALDIASGTFTSVFGLGFKDHNLSHNSLDALRNGKAELAVQNIYGVYMPDGIAAVTVQGTTYILTANEGDAREWGTGANAYADITAYSIEGNRIDVLDNTKKDGLEEGKKYILGARSFSIWDVSGGSARLVYDSGNEFETHTASYFPANFNASHTNNDLDSRSGRKGPEPEYVTTLRIGNRTYAIIGLERIGGIMVYDITNPQSSVFYDYINTRDFAGSGLAQMGDLGPEGISAVPASDSPTRRPLIFVANEVSGTIAVFEAR
ncbi:MAG: choice-of-anchor I family protein [Treponema sp.]|nr:choice-of-anchor I family protein [Treponema sp.]